MTAPRGSPRHPAARAMGADLAQAVRVVVARDQAPGRAAQGRQGSRPPEPTVAAAVMAVRGRQHRTRAQFAVAYGLSEEELVAIESGTVPLDSVPAVLRVLTPLDSVVGFCLGLGPPVVGLAGRGADQ